MKYELVEENIKDMPKNNYVKAIDENNMVYIIPVDVNNKDYQAYLTWLEKSGEK
jgi:hypothetical protein